MPPSVSVVIPCRNEEKTIHAVLDALRQQTYPQDLVEVVVADGLSTDATRTVIAAYQKRQPEMNLQLVDNPSRSIPSGVNAAIRAAHGEVIVRMDAHALPNADYIERCVHALMEGLGDNVGGVWDITPQNDTLMARAIAAAAAHPLAAGDARYRFAEKAGIVDTVPFGAFQRSLLEKIGYFDETLLSNEDYEFNTRIRQSGGKIWLDPNIRCVYYARKNLKELSKQYWRYGFWKAQMLKRYPKTLRLRQALPPVFVAGIGLLIAASFFFRPARIVLLAVLGVYLLALLLAGAQIAWRKKDFSLLFGVPPAIAAMHFSWGAAFWPGLCTRQTRTNH